MKKCKRLMKSIICMLMIVTMVFVELTQFNAFAATEEANEDTSIENDMTIESNNSFGDIIASEISQKEAEQLENNGYNIFSIEMNDNIATVSLQVKEDCTLVIGIYDEEGIKMLASGTKNVFATETETVAYIDTEQMPQYYYIKAYLVETDTLSPLCKVYNNPNYTQSMQEFFAKTTDDFEEDKVLQLDDDKTNNFAVYDDNTKLIAEGDTTNIITSIDEENMEYIISNVDETVSNLSEGDVFAYEYGDGQVLITKVASIEINGEEATIIGEEATLEETFEYVKISDSVGLDETELNDIETPEGVTYHGMTTADELVPYEEEEVDETSEEVTAQTISDEASLSAMSTFSVDAGVAVKDNMAFTFKNKKIGSDNLYATVKGSFNISLSAGAEVFWDGDNKYIEIKLEYSAYMNISLAGKGEGKLELMKNPIDFSVCPGVYISVKPAIVLEIDLELSLVAKLSGQVGFRASTQNGMENITTNPTFETSVKVEGNLFIGFSLEPTIKLIHEWIAKASLTATVGVKVTAKMEQVWNQEDKYVYHSCGACIDGDIKFEGTINAEAKFFNSDHLTFEIDLVNFSIDITKFYYSFDTGVFAWTACPNHKADTYIKVQDARGNAIQGAVIKAPFSIVNTSAGTSTDYSSLTTDTYGKVTGFLPIGTHKIKISAPGYRTVERTIVIEEKRSSMVYTLQDSDIIPSNEMISVLELTAYKETEAMNNNYFNSYYGFLGTRVNQFPVMTSGVDDITLEFLIYDKDGAKISVASSDVSPNIYDVPVEINMGTYHMGSVNFYQKIYYVIGFKYSMTDGSSYFSPVKCISFHETQIPAGSHYSQHLVSYNYEPIPSFVTNSYALSAMYTVGQVDEQLRGTAEFTDLNPDEMYNLYIMESKEAEDMLSADNLLYVSQGIADEEGMLSINYELTESYEDAQVLLVGTSKIDINDAQVVVYDIETSEEGQKVSPIVMFDGEMLTEGVDYSLSGDCVVNEIGEYTLMINGIGMFTGTKEVGFNVVETLDYGDANNDGRINVMDAVLMKKHIAGFDNLIINVGVCDVNNDEKVNVMDAVMVLKYIAGFDVVLGE